jgi:hypothetical protein
MGGVDAASKFSCKYTKVGETINGDVKGETKLPFSARETWGERARKGPGGQVLDLN